ncbi:MAG: alpha/beta hydrolase-fold protein [Bacteroidota bacterium]|nr:alpha/beta hydrolase-fold protein [Bacteroidota bacterium]
MHGIGQPENNHGTIRRFNDFRSLYVQARNIDVWLPDHYHPRNSYAVLYMHDGQNIFESADPFQPISWKVDITLSDLIRHHKIRPCIVVGIWNTEKRFQEFTPYKPFRDHVPPNGDIMFHEVMNNSISEEYLKFLVLELKPFIDATFSTLSDRDHTFIAGSSMGGLISVYALCEYPDIFGGAACLSTHWPLGIMQSDPRLFNIIISYLKVKLPPPSTHRIYFDHGTEMLDSLYPFFQSQVDRVLLEKGYSEQSWTSRIFEGHDHSELSWQQRFHIPATFLLTNNSR